MAPAGRGHRARQSEELGDRDVKLGRSEGVRCAAPTCRQTLALPSRVAVELCEPGSASRLPPRIPRQQEPHPWLTQTNQGLGSRRSVNELAEPNVSAPLTIQPLQSYPHKPCETRDSHGEHHQGHDYDANCLPGHGYSSFDGRPGSDGVRCRHETNSELQRLPSSNVLGHYPRYTSSGQSG